MNIEDGILVDFRFRKLTQELGDEDRAMGMLVRFWRQSQHLWGRGELMSEEEFGISGFEPILRVGLAEKRDAGYYAKGSEEQFQWYRQHIRAARKSVASRRKRASVRTKPVSVHTSDLIPSNILPTNTKGSNTNKSSVEPRNLGSPATALSSLPTDSKKRLEVMYPDDAFRSRELEKMDLWLSVNAHKRPRSPAGWVRFVGGWLARSWEKHRVSLPTHAPKALPIDHDALWGKVEGDG